MKSIVLLTSNATNNLQPAGERARLRPLSMLSLFRLMSSRSSLPLTPLTEEGDACVFIGVLDGRGGRAVDDPRPLSHLISSEGLQANKRGVKLSLPPPFTQYHRQAVRNYTSPLLSFMGFVKMDHPKHKRKRKKGSHQEHNPPKWICRRAIMAHIKGTLFPFGSSLKMTTSAI